MTVTVADFRQNFPAFTNDVTYTAAAINFWLSLGAKLISVDRWGDVFDYGLQLFVAHNLTLEYESDKAATTGGKPGQVVGAISSASVDKVSYSRDASSAMDPENGHWNLSTYGLRYIRLVKMMGAGPIQVGVPLGGGSNDYYPQAWPGPQY